MPASGRSASTRSVSVRASAAGATGEENQALRLELARLISVRSKLGAGGAAEMAAFLTTVEDPEAFVDIAAFSLCEDAALKQKLLETLDVHERLRLFGRRLRVEIAGLKLRRRLQGRLSDDQISGN